MEPDEVRAVMGDPVAQRLLASADLARLAYVATDGTPRVVPIAFEWDGARLVMGTVPASAKVAAIRANPAVALTIDTSPPVWPPERPSDPRDGRGLARGRRLPRVRRRREEGDPG